MLSFYLSGVTCSDRSAGVRQAHKVSKVNFGQQALMELLVEGLSVKEEFSADRKYCFFPFSLFESTVEDGQYKNACECRGVSCNAHDEVKRIDFSRKTYDGIVFREHMYLGGGSIDLSCIPQSVESFRLNYQSMEGSIETSHFPQGLRAVQLIDNAFSGRFDIPGLPEELINGYFRKNSLCGPIDLTEIPEKLQILDLSYNAIEQAAVIAGNFPQCLVAVRLKGNHIDSIVDHSRNALKDHRIILDDTKSAIAILAPDNT